VANSSPEAVFRARGLRKTYRTGDVEMQALRDVDELAQVEAALRRLGRGLLYRQGWQGCRRAPLSGVNARRRERRNIGRSDSMGKTQ